VPPTTPDDSPIAAEQTWSGVATPLSPKTVAVAVTKQATWARLWQRLSPEPIPEIDFTQHVVLAVIAGGADQADRVQIDEAKQSQGVLNVRYRLVSYARPFADDAKAAVPKKTVFYLLEAVPRTALKVKFERLTEGPNE
jgi:hypothetical protein